MKNEIKFHSRLVDSDMLLNRPTRQSAGCVPSLLLASTHQASHGSLLLPGAVVKPKSFARTCLSQQSCLCLQGTDLKTGSST